MSQQAMNNSILIYPLLDGDVSTGANISVRKLQQQQRVTTDFGKDRTDAVATSSKTVHVCTSGGILYQFGVMCAESGTTADLDFDLLVNGVSVLTSAVNFVSGTGDDTIQSGVITSSAVNAGDVISISLTANTVGGSQGPYARVYIDQAAI